MNSSVCRRPLTTLVALLFTAIVSGCGGNDFGPTGAVTGRLTFEGKPLAEGHAVSFMQMEKGFLAYGKTDAEGNFSVSSWNEGAMPVGKYKVMIAPPPAAAPAVAPTAEEQFDNPELVDPRIRSEFPARYRDPLTSGIEYEVTEGTNKFDIDLKAR